MPDFNLMKTALFLLLLTNGKVVFGGPWQSNQQATKINAAKNHQPTEMKTSVNEKVMNENKANSALTSLSHRQRLIMFMITASHPLFNSDLKEIGNKPFNLAAIMGDTEAMSDLLKCGVDIDESDPKYGITALLAAVIQRRFNSIKFLIDHGANVNLASKDGLSALHLACWWNDFRLTKFLVMSGANVNARTGGGVTPLMIAVRDGYEDIVRHLLSSGAELYHRHEEGWSAMNAAISNHHRRIVRMLLNAGYDPNSIDGSGLSPLEIAISKNDTEISVMFIGGARNKIVNLNAKDRRGTFPLIMAVMLNRTHIVKRLLKLKVNVHQRCETFGNITGLHLAVWNNQSEIAKLLLDAGSDSNARNGDGRTPLQDAITNNATEVGKLLLAAGADANGRNDEGMTVLTQAVLGNSSDFVRLLIHYKADVNRSDVLISAVYNSGTHIVSLLLDAGSDPNVRHEGFSPIHYAAHLNKTYIGKLLIDGGAEVNAKADSGLTPLMIAVQRNYVDFVKLLLRSGADVHETGPEGLTALHIAVFNQQSSVIKLLLEAVSAPGA